MAEMVVHSAQILELPQRHLVLSISNETQQLHPSQVIMKNARQENIQDACVHICGGSWQ